MRIWFGGVKKGMIHYYVDPGSGFVFAQNASWAWAAIMGFAGGFLVIFRFYFKFFWKWLLALILIISFIIIGGVLINKEGNKQRVVILGIDAMDPEITGRLMRQGRLPNLSALKQKGSYSRLATTVPAETVVAFTSIATGVNPGRHGIFDFIMRDPKNYMPYLSLNEITNSANGVKISMRRRAPALWQVLSEHNISSRIFFFPNTFPPDKVRGYMLSGMGVPDITGTMGGFTYYSFDEAVPADQDSRGRIIQVIRKNGVIAAKLYGPRVSLGGNEREAEAGFTVTAGGNPDEAVLCIGGKRSTLKKGIWSGWQSVDFKIGFIRHIKGIVQFYLVSGGDDFRLYASAINFDPENPLFPISYSAGYSREISRRDGVYHTQGMPHDTWGLNERKLSETAFLEHVDQIMQERHRILNSELKRFKSGLFFYYFDTLDVVQHMFWRYLDAQSPIAGADPRFENTIYQYYEKIDSIIGDALRRVDKDATVIVLSDHGFSPFRRAVHLNRWLLDNGFLALRRGEGDSKEFFESVDWSRTKAYAAGFGGIYINKTGREGQGIVSQEQSPELIKTIEQRLNALTDPANGQAIVSNVYKSADTYSGQYCDDAPDLYVGFAPGYRASWQTAMGTVPAALIEDNARKWSGDHLVDPRSVPGVIFTSKKIVKNEASVVDIAPSVYELFGISKRGLDGTNLLDAQK